MKAPAEGAYGMELVGRYDNVSRMCGAICCAGSIKKKNRAAIRATRAAPRRGARRWVRARFMSLWQNARRQRPLLPDILPHGVAA